MMQTFNKLYEISYSEVKPKGWLRRALEAEKNGVPGNLDRIGYPFNTKCWEKKTLTEGGYLEWWPYEQSAYWIDAIVRTAGLLEDEELYGKVKDQIDAVMQDEDWFIGPKDLKTHERCYRWPLGIMARALYAKWRFTGDESYLVKLRDCYLQDSSDYSGYRDIVNVETMFKVADYFKDERLHEKAVKAYEIFDMSDEKHSNATAMLRDEVPYQHGVTYNEHAKLAAIMYSYTGDERYLQAAEKGYKKLDDHFLLPDGVPTSCEFTEGNETKWAHESCVLSDYTWSLGYLLEATGDAKYADKIEWAFLNGAFGAMGPYFKTFQYFSSVNQPIAGRNSTNKNIKDFIFTPRMAYQPHHYPECCAGNIGRVIPNYVLRMYQTMEDGICVSLYGDSVYDGELLQLTQTGGYPFGDSVRFEVHLKKEKECKLRLRIPGWAKTYCLKRNGEEVATELSDGYVTLVVRDGDTTELILEKAFASHESPDKGVYFTYGPFLMSLKIEEDWKKDNLEVRQTTEFPAYQVYPVSAWNYCVSGEEMPDIHEYAASDNPFWDGKSIEIGINAKILHHWNLVEECLKRPEKFYEKERYVHANKMDEMDVMGLDAVEILGQIDKEYDDHISIPEIPNSEFVEQNMGETVNITLVPYGSTNLRITVFPKYGRKR